MFNVGMPWNIMSTSIFSIFSCCFVCYCYSTTSHVLLVAISWFTCISVWHKRKEYRWNTWAAANEFVPCTSPALQPHGWSVWLIAFFFTNVSWCGLSVFSGVKVNRHLVFWAHIQLHFVCVCISTGRIVERLVHDLENTTKNCLKVHVMQCHRLVCWHFKVKIIGACFIYAH